MAERQFVSDPQVPRLESLDDGRVEIAGDLSFGTVGELIARGADAIQGTGKTIFDLGKVTRTDSAGLALMVEWLRRARQKNTRIEIINMPEQMRSIARMSKLDGVLLADHG